MKTLCACGSGEEFQGCCQPYLNFDCHARTAEILMRSRYTGFVVKNEKYLLNTWHSRTRPPALHFENHPIIWFGLKILDRSGGETGDDTGTVSFVATYLENGLVCTLRENSQFIKENGYWYYLVGDNSLEKVKAQRNHPCPCRSGLKFKKCCLAK